MAKKQLIRSLPGG